MSPDINGQKALFVDWLSSGHAGIRSRRRIQLIVIYHVKTWLSLLNHIVIGTIRANGLSHTSNQLGEVA